jgi:hypothetical protein
MTKCPYLRISQLSVGEARSVVPFLAPLKPTSNTHSLTALVASLAGIQSPRTLTGSYFGPPVDSSCLPPTTEVGPIK